MQTERRLSSIQSLRALAVFAVLVRHCHDQFTLGSAGVDLFFVISGFIMVYASRELFGSRRNVAKFVRLRLIRIVPPYWIATTILVLVLGMPSIDRFIKSLLFFPDGQPFLTPGWSLTFEMFFYGLFACFIFLPIRTAVMLLSGTIVGIVLIGPHIRNPYVLYLSQPILIEFVFGALAGLAFVEGLRINRISSVCLTLAGLLLFAVSTTVGQQPIDGIRFVTWGIPACVLFVGAVFGPRTTVLEIKPIILLGNASYSLYLTHWFFVVTYGVGNPIATFVISLIFGIGFFFVVETPLVDLLRRWTRKANQESEILAPLSPKPTVVARVAA
jgi:exopolysaccharide production protein ExoZ